MGIHVPIPGDEDLNLDHLVLDANGTLTDRGETIICTFAPLVQLRQHLEIHLLAADTLRNRAGARHPDRRRVPADHHRHRPARLPPPSWRTRVRRDR